LDGEGKSMFVVQHDVAECCCGQLSMEKRHLFFEIGNLLSFLWKGLKLLCFISHNTLLIFDGNYDINNVKEYIWNVILTPLPLNNLMTVW